jgi:hypothetical protein
VPVCTINWNNAAGGDWNIASNWNPVRLPMSSDDVCINLAGSYTVTHPTGNHSINSLTSIADVTFNLSGGQLTVATTVQVNHTFLLSGGSLVGATVMTGTTITGTAMGGSLVNVTLDGNLNLTTVPDAVVNISSGLTLNGTANLGNSAGTTSGYLQFPGTQTLGGTGSIVFGGSVRNGVLSSADGASLTIGPNITI